MAGVRPRSAEDGTLDSAAVGLISGLEVHQQLLTERKLFCHCPAGEYTRTYDGVVLRHMRAPLMTLVAVYAVSMVGWVLVVTVGDVRMNVGLVRLEMLRAAEALA